MLRPHALTRLPTRSSPSLGLRARVVRAPGLQRCTWHRSFYTLGIETSCDDTCVAILNTDAKRAQVVWQHKITCPNKKHEGIHPTEAVDSHTRNLSRLIYQALRHIGNDPDGIDHGNKYVPKVGRGQGNYRPGPKVLFRPDLIAVTRGPGMNACLRVGISAAKALSAALGVPLIGVHHMQAHALTPRMEAAVLRGRGEDPSSEPNYPFLTLLVSGGHTMLVYTTSNVNHRVLASTSRGTINPQEKASAVAIGEMLDKCAREILPEFWIPPKKDSIVYARLLEAYVSYAKIKYKTVSAYEPPRKREDEIRVYNSEAGWAIPPPLRLSREMKFDFSGLGGKVRSIIQEKPSMDARERADLGYHAMRLAFEHLGSRVIMALQNDAELLADPPEHLVLSGGVAQNKFLRKVLREMLKVRGFGDMKLIAPTPAWCSDNAVMIAWAGADMYHSGWTTDDAFLPKGEWPIEQIITGTDCWINSGSTPVDQEKNANGQQTTPSAQEPPQFKADNAAPASSKPAPPRPSAASNVPDAGEPNNGRRHKEWQAPLAAYQASKEEKAKVTDEARLQDLEKQVRQLQRNLFRATERTKAKGEEGPPPPPEPEPEPAQGLKPRAPSHRPRPLGIPRQVPRLLGLPASPGQPRENAPWPKREPDPAQAELLAAESRLGGAWAEKSPAPVARYVPVRGDCEPLRGRVPRASIAPPPPQQQQPAAGGDKDGEEEKTHIVRLLRPRQPLVEEAPKPATSVASLRKGLSTLKRWAGL